MAVLIVRLTTGEELIAQVEEKGEAIHLQDVAILIPTQQNSLGLAPFMAYSDASKGFTIQPKDVMFVVSPVKDLENQYNQMFGKLLTPQKKIIV